jgi:hypothetical protein
LHFVAGAFRKRQEPRGQARAALEGCAREAPAMAIEMLEIRHTGVRFDVERIRRYGSPPP